MRQVTVHGALLAVALVAAWVTWTANEPVDTGEATITVWDDDPGDIAVVSFESGDRTLLLERRDMEAQSYLWARETTRPVPPQPEQPEPDSAAAAAAAADTGAAPASSDTTNDLAETDVANAAPAADSVAPEAAAQEPARVTEFPVGEQGDSLITGLAQLRAVRDLGEADDDLRAAYGFADSTVSTVTLRQRDGAERTLALGGTAIGGSDRYVLDVERNRVFAVPVAVVRPLETSQMLRLTEYQRFEPDDVARVAVTAGGAQRTMERRDAGATAQVTWSPPDSEQQDPAFASFMEQVDQLWVSEFVPEASVDSLELMLRIDYYSRRDDAIGFIELYRARGGEGEAQGSPRYFMRSPRTVVLGEVYGPLGERLEQDVETLFGGAPAATSASVPAPGPTDASP